MNILEELMQRLYKPEAEEGYIALKPTDTFEIGDQYQVYGEWREVDEHHLGVTTGSIMMMIYHPRRKV